MIYRCVERIRDSAWQSVPIVYLSKAETGEPANQATAVKMCWDDKCFHVAFECTDSDIQGTFGDHDDPIYLEETVEVFICPDGDLSCYYEIDVSPKTVVFDALIHYRDSDGSIDVDKAWDCANLQTAVVIERSGWTVEMAIQFASLGRATPKSREEWRINLYRIDRSADGDEFQAWSPTLVSPADFHIPERFGSLVFEHRLTQIGTDEDVG
jgi:hypothetical protein